MADDHALPRDPWAGAVLAYRQARRLEHGEGLTARTIVEQLAQATPRAGEPDPAAAAADPSGLSVLALNVLGLRALTAGDWATARALASEVTAADHHDLVAQRIGDAAEAECCELDTPLEAWLSDRICTAPFEEMETRENGDVHFCCSAWQPVPIGRIGAAEDPWTSRRAAEIRRSVTEGDFSHCSRWHCPRIADRRLPRRTERRLPQPQPRPRRVILSHDRSCNLACPSCRSELIQADHAASERLWTLYLSTLAPLVEAAERVKITGSGDPFGSRHFRRVIARLTERPPTGEPQLQLQTNGLLFDDRAWTELNLWGHVASVWVSIDAARADTYQALRGGDFGKLMDNLIFLGEMRRAGALPFLRLDLVVQRDNYDEMGEAVDLSRRIGADGCYFLRLRNWGTFSRAAFGERDVCDPVHPEHGRLLERLADPRLGAPGVELGSMAPLRARALASCAGFF